MDEVKILYANLPEVYKPCAVAVLKALEFAAAAATPKQTTPEPQTPDKPR